MGVTLTKGTTHTLEKWTESREREVSPGAESTDTEGRQGAKLNAPVNILITLTVNNDINGATLKWSQRCHPRGTALHFLSLKLCKAKTGQTNLCTKPNQLCAPITL